MDEETKKLLKQLNDNISKLSSKEESSDEPDSEEKEVDVMISKLTDAISKSVSDAISASKEEDEDKKNKAADLYKGVDFNGRKLADLSKEEKIAEFFKALVSKDEVRTKALAEGTDGQGGHLVPEEFKADIVAWQRDNINMRRLVTVFPMKSRTLELPALAVDINVYWGSENTSISTSSIDFGNVQLTARKLNAMIYLSTELVEDSMIDVQNFITDRFAQAVTDEEDRTFINGNGTTQPKGILQYSIASIAGGNAESIDKLNSIYWRTPKSHRAKGAWLMAGAALETLSAKKDSNGQYLLTNPVTDGEFPKFKGKPVFETDHVGNNIVFGDMRFYYVGDRRQLSVKTTTEGAGTFEKDQVAIKITERLDGKMALLRAFRKVTSWR